jgi:hypothetical protein
MPNSVYKFLYDLELETNSKPALDMTIDMYKGSKAVLILLFVVELANSSAR